VPRNVDGADPAFGSILRRSRGPGPKRAHARSGRRSHRLNGAIVLLTVAMLAASCQMPSPGGSPAPSPIGTASASPGSPYGSPGLPTAQLSYPHRTVFVQLFEWKWTDVAQECEQWLGPHGFAAVQISPPQEHAEIDSGGNHFPWWERYQPVSYTLASRSGTRAEFADMVGRCRAAGIDIYADVILNHMAAGSGTGSAGTVYTKYSYPGVYGTADFHANANPAYPNILCDHSIQDFGDPEQVRTCELSGLADLRTEEPSVQGKLAGYMADLYGLGVRGYLSKFFPLGEFRHGVGAGLLAMYVGIIELFLEFVKPVTLAMRLFGNIYGGEVALAVISALTLAVLPVALYGLEALLNVIQALIFSVLTLMFILIAIEGHGSEEHHPATADDNTGVHKAPGGADQSQPVAA